MEFFENRGPGTDPRFFGLRDFHQQLLCSSSFSKTEKIFHSKNMNLAALGSMYTTELSHLQTVVATALDEL